VIRSTRCRLHRWVATSTAVVACALVASPATAQDDDETSDPIAVALFRKGRDLVTQNRWEQGCAMLAQSFERTRSASTLLNLARCDEHEGKIATAWAKHHQAISLTASLPGARRDELVRIARQGIAQLEPRLPKLFVTLRSPSTDVTLLDERGRPVPPDVDVPLDPGPHEIGASAKGRRSATFSVELAAGRTTTLSVALEELPTANDTWNVPPVRPDPISSAPPAPASPITRETPWLGYGLGALGLAFGAAAVGFGVDAANASSELSDRCGSDLVCNEDPTFDPDPLNGRKNRGLALGIGLGTAGLVAIGAGIGIVAKRASTGRRVGIVPSPRGAVVVVPF
jgi:hypothetical protein